MPIAPEKELLDLLRNQTISALTIDTNIFDEKGLQLSAAPLATVAILNNRPFDFLLSGTVANEIVGHLEKRAEDALRTVRKAIGEALYAFETVQPTRDQLLDQITGAQTARGAAQARFSQYVQNTGCEILPDEDLVTTKALFDGYFRGQAPFGTGKKKDEFPDALALHALEATASMRQKYFLVVSKDGDWRKFCAQSQRLYFLSELETALALLNDPPLVVRQSVLGWLAADSDGRAEIRNELEGMITNLDVDVNGYPTSGEMEAIPYGAELRNVEWADDADVDIIETSDPDEQGIVTAVLSMPLQIDLRVHVELTFSVWDSVDRESVSMGGRTVEVDETYDTRATVTVRMHDLGTENQEIEFASCEIDLNDIHLELGDVDVFEPEDYYDDTDEKR